MTTTSLLSLCSARLGSLHLIDRHEMAALLTEWSRLAPGSLANGCVPGTWPDALGSLGYVPDDAEAAAIWDAVPDSYHVRAGRAWAQAIHGITIISASDDGGLRDGQTRYDQPGSMAPGQMADVSFVGDSMRLESRQYMGRHCRRLIVVREESPLIAPPEHADVDGRWVRYIYADSLPVDWMDARAVRDYEEEFGEAPDTWEQMQPIEADPLEPHRILQMIDPNSGLGNDHRRKQRYQYVRIDGVVLSRTLPPETVGDVWRDERGPRPFQPHEREAATGLSDYVLSLLDLEVRS